MKKTIVLYLLMSLLSIYSHGKEELSKITLAGGCFWCMEPPFDRLAGVISTTSGYIGGKSENPDYKSVSRGGTGHTEAVQVVFDPKLIQLSTIFDVFWKNIDPTDNEGQFVDRGSQYRPGIFYYSEDQKLKAFESKKRLVKSKRFKKPIVVEITKASKFFSAELYHQNYYKKNPIRYKFYRFNSGRDQFLRKHWKK